MVKGRGEKPTKIGVAAAEMVVGDDLPVVAVAGKGQSGSFALPFNGSFASPF
jgi:hypothetical protein